MNNSSKSSNQNIKWTFLPSSSKPIQN
jgi:hypothetical protein